MRLPTHIHVCSHFQITTRCSKILNQKRVIPCYNQWTPTWIMLWLNYNHILNLHVVTSIGLDMSCQCHWSSKPEYPRNHGKNFWGFLVVKHVKLPKTYSQLVSKLSDSFYFMEMLYACYGLCDNISTEVTWNRTIGSVKYSDSEQPTGKAVQTNRQKHHMIRMMMIWLYLPGL